MFALSRWLFITWYPYFELINKMLSVDWPHVWSKWLNSTSGSNRYYWLNEKNYTLRRWLLKRHLTDKKELNLIRSEHWLWRKITKILKKFIIYFIVAVLLKFSRKGKSLFPTIFYIKSINTKYTNYRFHKRVTKQYFKNSFIHSFFQDHVSHCDMYFPAFYEKENLIYLKR